MAADGVVVEAPFRFLGQLDLGEQEARRRFPPGEPDACCLADHAASAIAPDEVFGPDRPAVGQLDVDPGVVLREARHLTPAMDRHRELVDPFGEQALDVDLPQREPVGVPSGEVADVQWRPCECRNLHRLSLRQEPIGDATLVEHLDGASVQAARPLAGKLLAGTSLDDGDVHPRERQLRRQHQPRRPATDDHHRMLGHAAPPCVADGPGHSLMSPMPAPPEARTHRKTPRCAESFKVEPAGFEPATSWLPAKRSPS